MNDYPPGTVGAWILGDAVAALGQRRAHQRDDQPRLLLAKVAIVDQEVELWGTGFRLQSAADSSSRLRLTVELVVTAPHRGKVLAIKEQEVSLGELPNAALALPAVQGANQYLTDLFDRWQTMWERRIRKMAEATSLLDMMPFDLTPYPEMATALARYFHEGPPGPRPRRIVVDAGRLERLAALVKPIPEAFQPSYGRSIASFELEESKIYFCADTDGSADAFPRAYSAIFIQVGQSTLCRPILAFCDGKDSQWDFVDRDGAAARDFCATLREIILASGQDRAVDFTGQDDDDAAEDDDEEVSEARPSCLPLSEWLEFRNVIASDVDGALDWRVHRDIFSFDDGAGTGRDIATAEEVSTYHQFIRRYLDPNFVPK
jgi:hypothetical protein